MKPRICIPVCVARASELAPAFARAAQLADIVEIRLDYLQQAELAPALAALRALLADAARPVILTRRILEQGGQSDFSALEAPDFWRQTAVGLAWRDMEGDWLPDADALPQVIASHHDFNGTPNNLTKIYERLATTGAGVLKIAVTAHDITDCLPVFQLLQRAAQEGRPLIALAMGEAGLLTRVLGPAFGSWLTFAALDDTQRTASGQFRADELRDLYRFAEITRETPVYGLIGWPVSHSLSPQVHNRALAAQNLPGVYLPLAVRDVDAFMRRMAQPATRELNWNLRGLSVTAPHKQAVMPHLDWVSPEAKAIGAVNTIVLTDSSLRGYNTDATGFIASLREVYRDLRDARGAVLGAGGAARCAVWALRQAGAEVTIMARDETRATALAQEFGATAGHWGQTLSDFDIVVNATPLGTRGPLENDTPANAAQLSGVRLAYDLVYNPRLTPFLQEAQAAGCAILGGLPMLVSQAAAQFSLWTNHDAPLAVMRQAAQDAIS